MTLRLTFILAVSAALFGAGAAEAASFNCARARAADERAICADRALNDKDVRMATTYQIAGHFLAMGRRGVLDDAQTHWLKGRHACGANRQCLNAAYDHRQAALQAVLDEVYTHGPF